MIANRKGEGGEEEVKMSKDDIAMSVALPRVVSVIWRQGRSFGSGGVTEDETLYQALREWL